jgi:hypothetical protein
MVANPAAMADLDAAELATKQTFPTNRDDRNPPSGRKGPWRQKWGWVAQERQWSHSSVRKVRQVVAHYLRAKGENVERVVIFLKA